MPKSDHSNDHRAKRSGNAIVANELYRSKFNFSPTSRFLPDSSWMHGIYSTPVNSSRRYRLGDCEFSRDLVTSRWVGPPEQLGIRLDPTASFSLSLCWMGGSFRRETCCSRVIADEVQLNDLVKVPEHGKASCRSVEGYAVQKIRHEMSNRSKQCRVKSMTRHLNRHDYIANHLCRLGCITLSREWWRCM